MLEILENPIVIGVLVFLAMVMIVSLTFKDKAEIRKEKVLQEISSQYGGKTASEDETSALRGHRMSESDTLNQFLTAIPGLPALHGLLLNSGSGMSMPKFLLIYLVFIAIVTLLMYKIVGLTGIVIGLVVGAVLPVKYLQRKVLKRNELFINMFPDAIDMIVRSVRSGHPLNASLRMIAENMQDPVSTEFKQVVDEVSYGRTLPEAMRRMAQRIGEADVKFFVVVLSVQQETGGNLAEVLSNLSNIIRKRKQLRMKIKAMTSEGRMTMWILGGLPVVEFGILWTMSPDYLEPLFTTTPGQVVFGIAIGLVLLCFWVVSRMINIEI